MAEYDEEVVVDTEEEEELPLVFDEESLNLVEAFQSHPDGIIALADISAQVLDDFDADWSSTEEYREKMADDWKLFAGHMPGKDFPFENCANGNIPIMMENLLRLHARYMSEIFGDWTSVVGVVPMGADDDAVAQAMSKHDNWQIREDIPDFQRQQDRAVMNFLGPGDVTSHSFYDAKRKQNRHEILTPDEFVVPYVITSTYPDYSDVPHYTKILRRYRHEIQAMKHAWVDVDKVVARESIWGDGDDSPIREEMADVQGESEPDSGEAPYKLLQYEGYTSLLPNQEEDRFIQAIVDPETQRILSLRIHEEVHWKDRVEERARREELANYKQARTEHAQLKSDHNQRRFDMMQQDLEQGVSVEEQEMREAQGGAIPEFELPEPMAPSWVDDPDDLPEEPPRTAKQPIRMFGHGVNVEPPMGGLGLGYGRIQADLTAAGNTVLNQFIDQATLHNAPPVLSSFEMPKEFEWAPGRTIKVDAPIEDLSKGLFPMPSAPANPQLLEVLKTMQATAQSSVQAPDVLSGAAGKSGETFKGLASRIEQATKQLGVGARKFANGILRTQINNNARLNAKFLPETQLLRLLDPTSLRYQDVQIDRSMYERDYRVEFRADLRFTSEAQKMQEAQAILQLPAQVPALQMNQKFQYEALVGLLEAMNRQDLVDTLGAPPPTPPQFGPPSPGPQPPGSVPEAMGGAAPGGQPPQGPPQQ